MTGSNDLSERGTSRRCRRVTTFPVIVLVAAVGVTSCSSSQESSTVMKADQAVPKEPAQPFPPVRPAMLTVDSKELMNTMDQLVAAYNKGSYVVASRYVDDEVVARCGGAQNYAVATRQNSAAEQLAYTVERVEVTGGVEARVEADVYYSSKDVRTGRAIDVHQGNGLTFVRSNRPDIRWVLADPFPLGVAGYCR